MACLPWVREQTAARSDLGTAECETDRVEPLAAAVEASAAIVEGSSGPSITQDELIVGDFLGERDSVSNDGQGSESFAELFAAVQELQVVVGAPLRA